MITTGHDIDIHGLVGREILQARARIWWQQDEGAYAIAVAVWRQDEQLWCWDWPHAAGRGGYGYVGDALAAARWRLVDSGYMSLRAGDPWEPAEPGAMWQCGTYTRAVADFR